MRAKLKAARKIHRGWVRPSDLPSNAEIRDEIQSFARIYEGDLRTENLLEMRLEALWLMQLLHRFRPRLIGSVFTGHVRQGSDIDIHVFSDSVEAITAILDQQGMVYDVERKSTRKDGEYRTFTHIHVQGRFPFELTMYASNKAHFVFKSSITGKAIERASIAELENFLCQEYPDLDFDEELQSREDRPDRWQYFESLLLPLENVKQSPKYHPEGDALYHSLQVFELARNESPYDTELLEAALLHDIGKAIDPDDHVQSALEALSGYISPRTAWLIANHMEAHKVLDRSIGARARKRLGNHESYEDLLTLGRCDRDGRVAGAEAPELDEALDYLREMGEMFG